MKEVTTSPWLQTIKRSVSAEQRGSREEGGFAQGWVRRYISRQGSPLVRERRKSQLISQRDKQEEQSLQDPSYAELQMTKHSRESPLRAYKPGLWRMAAVRGLRKRWTQGNMKTGQRYCFFLCTYIGEQKLPHTSISVLWNYQYLFHECKCEHKDLSKTVLKLWCHSMESILLQGCFFKAVSIPNNESKHFVLDLVVLVSAPMKATINKRLMQNVIFVNMSPYVSILWRRTNAVGSSLRSWPIERMFEFAKFFLSNL